MQLIEIRPGTVLLLPLAAQPSASDSATGWHCAL